MKIEFKTKIGYNAGSYTTVVPSTLADLLGIEKGDCLIWNVDIRDEGATILVEPKKSDKK